MTKESDSSSTSVENISSQLATTSASGMIPKAKKKKNTFIQMDVPIDVSTKRVKKNSVSKERRNKAGTQSENISDLQIEDGTFPVSNEWDENKKVNNETKILSKGNHGENYKNSNTPKQVICGTMNLFDSKRSNFSYYLESNRRALLRCCADAVINFNGVMNIRVLQGTVRICGYSITKKETHLIKVFSLNAYNYLPIELLRSDRTSIKKNKLTKALRELDISEENIQAIAACLEPQHCLLYIENAVESSSNQSDKILFHMIHRLNHSIPCLLPERNYFHGTHDPADLLEKHLNIRFLKTINNTIGAPVLMQPTSWASLYEQCIESNQNARLVLCGGSGLGKTTLLRYLINRSIQEFGKALVLDFDPGQSEFFLPGTVSASVIDAPLLGPNFTHVRHSKPERSYFLGDVKIHSNAHIYVQYIGALLSYCHSREDLSRLPWFINTMGYVKDQGAQLNCRIIQDTQPTHVIQIRGRKPEENFTGDLTWDYVCKNAYQSSGPSTPHSKSLNFELFPLDSVKNNPFDNMNKSLKPADRRKIMLTAYFSPLFSTIPQDEYTVNQCIPYGAKLKYLQVDMTSKSGTQLSRGEILAAMNGEMVALAGTLQKNAPPQCLGYGIVYCIDSTSQELFLVSPLSLSRMSVVKSLLLGSPSLSLPRKFLDARCKELLGQRLPYASTSTGEGQITSQTTSRSYRNPGKNLHRAQRS